MRREEGLKPSSQTGVHRYARREELEQQIRKTRYMFLASRASKGTHVVRAIFDRWFREQGGRPDQIFVEKTPGNVFHIKEYLRYMPEAKAIDIVRDPRNVYLSLERMAAHPRQAWARAASEKDQVLRWVRSVEAGHAASEAFPDRVARVRYEDLRVNLQEKLEPLLRFAGLEATSERLSDIEQKTQVQKSKTTISGRGAVDSAEWKKCIPENVLRLFDETAGPWMDRYGYPRSQSLKPNDPP